MLRRDRGPSLRPSLLRLEPLGDFHCVLLTGTHRYPPPGQPSTPDATGVSRSPPRSPSLQCQCSGLRKNRRVSHFRRRGFGETPTSGPCQRPREPGPASEVNGGRGGCVKGLEVRNPGVKGPGVDLPHPPRKRLRPEGTHRADPQKTHRVEDPRAGPSRVPGPRSHPGPRSQRGSSVTWEHDEGHPDP